MLPRHAASFKCGFFLLCLLQADLWPDWRRWEATPASSASSSAALPERQNTWCPSGTVCVGARQSPGLHLNKFTPTYTHIHSESNGVKWRRRKLRWSICDFSPRATAATVSRTNRFLLRKALTWSRLTELILSFMLLAFLSMALHRRRFKSPLSGLGVFSASSFRKRLALLGGFSFIISSSTWSKRQVSWETEHKDDNIQMTDFRFYSWARGWMMVWWYFSSGLRQI